MSNETKVPLIDRARLNAEYGSIPGLCPRPLAVVQAELAGWHHA